MFEDEESKIRRNLLTVSAAILLFAWLNVPPGAIAKRLFGETGGFVLSPTRFWPALLALLIYLAARFQYCDEFATQFGRFKVLLATARNAKRKHFLAGLLDRFVRTAADTPIFGNQLNALFNTVTSKRFGVQNVGWKSGWGVLEVSVSEQGWGRGLVGWEFAERDGTKYVYKQIVSLGYVMPWRREVASYLYGWRQVGVFSRSSLDVLWPCAACLAATAVLGWKIGSALQPHLVSMLL